jgi:predicted  nucleic acid-binding Zn-ribbon protein
MSNSRRADRGGVALIISIAVVVLVVAALVFHFASRRRPAEVRNFQELVMRVDKLNTQISDRESDIMDMVRKYNAAHPDAAFDTTGIAQYGLSPEQADILAKRIAQEKDVSYRGLLQEVLDLNTQIDGLNQQLVDVRSKLPAPYEVKEGDSHLKVCLSYLTEKGVAEEDAMKLIEQTALTTELLPGFEVWNYYNDGIFGTFVTQGSARMSPNALTRATKRRIDTERQNLIQARNQKEQEVHDLESRREELKQSIQNLEEERTSMMSQMSEMAQKNEDLARQLNTLRYQVGTFKDLSKQGLIRKPTLGKWESDDLDKVTDATTLDLRSDNRITFTASSLGMNKIGQIVLFPRSYDDESDYKIILSDDKQSATVVLQKPDKFRLGKIAIAVD